MRMWYRQSSPGRTWKTRCRPRAASPTGGPLQRTQSNGRHPQFGDRIPSDGEKRREERLLVFPPPDQCGPLADSFLCLGVFWIEAGGFFVAAQGKGELGGGAFF